MEFLNFRTLQRSKSISLLFPGWKRGESVAFLSPHDDDIILGAGYLLSSTIENKGIPHVFIFSKGDAGYSSPEEKNSIVEKRKKEAIHAYQTLGVEKENLHFFGLPDFSIMPYVNRFPPRGKEIFKKLVKIFREKKVERVIFSSGYFENWDHTAVFNIGMYVSPQAGDPVLADLGKTHSVKSYFIYSVWGDFEACQEEPKGIRADFGILAGENHEEKIMAAIKTFSSQRKIIGDIVALRKKRKSDEGHLELYKDAGLRKPIDFKPYLELIPKCKKV